MVYRTRTVNDRFMLDPRRDLGRETFSLLLFSRSPLRERGDATRADLVKSSWIPDGGGDCALKPETRLPRFFASSKNFLRNFNPKVIGHFAVNFLVNRE